MGEFLTELLPIVISGQVPGHGQGIKYEGKAYYYACETEIPRKRLVSLVREGNTLADREWLIVTWDETEESFRLLEVVKKDLMRRLTDLRKAERVSI